ncbi:MAG TPA: glycosyltransferase family 2 protein [Vicinamibacterales bacterium]|jgi:glycosyltransferase involved in cell wall biosynthesis|nr:glycosyltransferase family 2 protein [Vicinamibacterales bacterium]
MTFSILIATYNRAAMLGDTLASLARLQPRAPWEVIVIDNNSPDSTREIVERAMPAFPVPLRYAFEREQGRSAALNCGFRLAQGDIIVTTDDDVRVEPDWLNRIEAGLASEQCDYVGGRVLPLWGAEPPRWLPKTNGQLWAVIALLDYGRAPLQFGKRVPLGVNMAMRKSAIDRVGGFDPRIGRKAGTLLGQEVREWCLRAHAAGLTGFYIPDLVVQHIIPADRLTKQYFRRWFYWRGISRAMLYAETGLDMEKPEQTTLDFSAVPHIAGVPRYMFRSAVKALKESIAAAIKGDPIASFDRELWLCFFAGVVKQRWRDRQRAIAPTTRLAAG